MDIRTPLIADDQAAESVEPRKGTLHDPSIPSDALGRLDPAPRNPGPNLATSASESTATKVVGLIGMHLVRPSPRTARGF